jgi:Na+/H+ antiporter NhaD/arsenite permease-like protein
VQAFRAVGPPPGFLVSGTLLRMHPAPPPPGGPEHVPAARPSRVPLVVYGVLAVVALLLGFLGRRDAEGITVVLGTVEFPYAFLLFAMVLVAVALFHHHTLAVALTGVVVVTAYTAVFAPPAGGLWHHFVHEGEHTLLNLGGLLVGFALLAKTFEESGAPEALPRFLPKAPFASAFALLALVFLLSSFLDNIAAAMIGGVIARTVFGGRVTVTYLAAIVAASNAGGAPSVVGDTTTTMMWIAKVPALEVAHAAIAAVVALLVVGTFGALGQNRVQPMMVTRGVARHPVDGVRLGIVALILVGAISTNIFLDKPFLGVWAAILLGALVRKPAWGEVPGAAKGALFLLSLVWCASLMPVKALPPASWSTTFGLGFVSAVFDNIPLTKLALDQNGYDWGMLAYAVGFGGSMIWFGSSAGVAISKDYPEARSVARWVKEGWFVPVAYVLGFFALYGVLGWQPYVIPR